MGIDGKSSDGASDRTRDRGAFRVRLLAVLIVPVILIGLLVGCDQKEPESLLSLTAPAETDRASVLVEGRTGPSAMVSIEGGVLPVETTADPAGRLRADVPLRPGSESDLQVRAKWPAGQANKTIHVRQLKGKAKRRNPWTHSKQFRRNAGARCKHQLYELVGRDQASDFNARLRPLCILPRFGWEELTEPSPPTSC